MAEPIIHFQGVQKAFGDKVIFEDLSMDVRRGETLTIIGGSGVGKSVCLKLLIALLRPNAGKIVAFGESVYDMNEAGLIGLRKRISMLFQGAALFDSMSVEENIKYPLNVHSWGTEGEMDKRVSEVLDLVDMPGVQKLRPAELSGGMKKRVGLARAIAIQPEVILYDEPTTGLDPINVRRINGLILSLQARLGVTSVVVTHDMDTVFTITDRLALVRDKRIAFIGTPDEAKTSELRFLREFVQGGRGTLSEDL
jgi:phospholipid/cholesterol/gamma-HCH transport system ATP-binding protein